MRKAILEVSCVLYAPSSGDLTLISTPAVARLFPSSLLILHPSRIGTASNNGDIQHLEPYYVRGLQDSHMERHEAGVRSVPDCGFPAFCVHITICIRPAGGSYVYCSRHRHTRHSLSLARWSVKQTFECIAFDTILYPLSSRW